MSLRNANGSSGARAWTLALALGALACATPMTQQDVENKLRSAGASVRSLGPEFVVVPVHADSRAAAWTLIAEARTDGGLLGERLSHDLRRGARRRGAVVVGGPYPDLTRWVLLDALRRDDRSLDGLTLVYVGDSRFSRQLRHAANARSVRFYQRNLP